MKLLRFILPALIAFALIYCMNRPFGAIPATGPLFDPIKGFMANAPADDHPASATISLPGVSSPVEVYFDERLVPHIFADNEHDLYYAQGYITASMRLWQMEMTSFAAAGRVSEKLGGDFLEYDRLQRRMGMYEIAKNTWESLDKNDPVVKAVIAYADGVNGYIDGLNTRTTPLEYKLMGFQPETWDPIKSVLLMMYMSKTLSGYDDDAAYSNILNMIGEEDFNRLYPDRYTSVDPIIPSERTYDFVPAMVEAFLDNPPVPSITYGNMDAHRNTGVGSNNWAVNGEKSATGNPLLCNDPHLPLNLPSLWYEVQLSTPENTVYGVSLPGSPCVIIGFNEDIAWGVTNAGWDVRDWYSLNINEKMEYAFEGTSVPLSRRLDTIYIKGGAPFIDTIYASHHGPLVYYHYSEDYKGWGELAMHWAAAAPSLELRTFYELNYSKTYDDYRKAISTFTCPAQNIVFASRTNDIAISIAGQFPLRYPGQGKTLMDGSKAMNDWQAYIPQEHNPYIVNPERGFVSSANQHPTDSTYPYYYMGFDFEHFRNRRINQQLSSKERWSVADMQQLQQDNYNMIAAESVPHLLKAMESNSGAWLDLLAGWDFYNTAESKAPTFFQIWWDNYLAGLWDEFSAADNINLVPPKHAITIQAFDWEEDYTYFDQVSTPQKETRTEVIRKSFEQASLIMDSLEALGEDAALWYRFKGTSIMHLANLEPFSSINIPIGGNKHIVNATSSRNGPSWRMVVELADPMNAYGVYPGGQSGHPGSSHYDDFIDNWASGQYYKLQFFKDKAAAASYTSHHLTLLQP